jgi:hypothetical protein
VARWSTLVSLLAPLSRTNLPALNSAPPLAGLFVVGTLEILGTSYMRQSE